MRHAHHVEIAGIGAGADTNLIHGLALQLLDGLDVVGRVGTSRQRLQLGEVDFNHLIIYSVVVRAQLAVILFSVLCLQKGSGGLVGGEHRGGGAQLGAHVGDGRSFGHAQGLDALAAVFHDLADAALDAHHAQHGENDVLCRYPRRELAGEVDSDHLGHGDVVGAASHGDRHVQAACADRQHTDAAAGGGVAVGADQGLAGLAEALQMHLMADAVAGARKINAVLFAHRLNKAVVVGILKACLQCVVVDIGDALLGLDARNAHRLILDIRHCACRVLRQRLVDFQTDVAADGHFAGHKVLFNDFLRNCVSHVESSNFHIYVNYITICGRCKVKILLSAPKTGFGRSNSRL